MQRVVAKCFNKKGRLLSVGENSYIKTHPWQARLAKKLGFPAKQYLHAEIQALLRARTKVHKISVVRINKQGKYRMAKPCPICEEAIRVSGVKIVEYST